MKVLYLTNIPSPYRVDFFNEMGKGCELTVIYERKSAINRQWEDKEALNFTPVFLGGLKVGKDSALSLDVIKYLNQDFDKIVIGGYSTPTGILAILYLKLRNKDFIINCDGGMIKNDRYIVYLIKKFLISSAVAWLSPSNNTSRYLVHYGAREDNIYNYRFTSLMKRDILLERPSEDEQNKIRNKIGIKEENVIVCVGQFIYRKGFDVLLKSMEFINCNRLGVYIIGGSIINNYQEIINELGIENVYFINFKNKEELFEYYKAADCFVFPTREDIWGLVVNEAMACGLPIITTENCGAGIEMIKDGENGFIIPVDNPQILANKIEVIIKDKILREKISLNNLRDIKKYSIEEMAKQHLVIFNSIT